MLFEKRFPSASIARQGSNLIGFKFTEHLSGGLKWVRNYFSSSEVTACVVCRALQSICRKLKYLFSRPSALCETMKSQLPALAYFYFIRVFVSRERSLIKLSLIKTLCVKIDFLWLLEHTNTQIHRTCCCRGNGMSKNIEISNIVKMTWAHMKLQCGLEYSHAYKAIGILGPC